MMSARNLLRILGLIAGVSSCGPGGASENASDPPVEQAALAQAQQRLDATT
jgi:hypothetical protein